MRALSARLLAVAACFLTLLAVVTGCASKQTDADPLEAMSVRVSGSGTCRPLVQILSDAYETRTDDVEFSYLPGLHSGGGIRGVASDDLDLGMVSRGLTDEEMSIGLPVTWLSNDGLLIAVHKDVPVDDLTTEQVKAIYRGDHTNWSEFGGPDLPITVLDRNEDESAKIILRKYVIGDLQVTDRAVNLFYEPDMVEGLTSTPGAIGYFSLGYALSREIPVRHVRLDGVEASVENVKNGRYPVVRPLGVVTSTDPPAEITEFLEWTSSAEAMGLIEAKGYAPPAR